jgi:hypothetical protein
MSKNSINVTVSTGKPTRVNVSAPTNQQAVDVTRDTSAYNAELAKQWAVAEGLVLSEDYSSKHYANVSKTHAGDAKDYLDITIENYNNFIAQSSNALGEIAEVKEGAIEEINATKTTIINDIEFVADGEKKEIEDLIDSGKDEIQELTNEIKDNAEDIINRVGISMFDTILKDHVLTYEESKGLALQGTYVYKEALAGSRYGYPDFYAKCVEEYNEATGTETVNGVAVKVHSNGHKFYDIADKGAIDTFFGTMGTAWFYGVDTENERVFLPRNNYFIQATANGSEVGQSVEAGLPNHYHHTVSDASVNTALTSSNYVSRRGSVEDGDYKYRLAGTSTAPTLGKTDNASVANSIYGKSSTVQPNAVKQLLYICVGNTTSYEGVTEVVNQGMEILEQVNQGIKEAADGQWVAKTYWIFDINATETQTPTFSLAEYLPNDGYSYEVLISGYVATVATSGAAGIVNVKKTAFIGDELGSVLGLCYVRARSAATVQAQGSCVVPIGVDRLITFDCPITTGATVRATALAYRRIGTNI